MASQGALCSPSVSVGEVTELQGLTACWLISVPEFGTHGGWPGAHTLGDPPRSSGTVACPLCRPDLRSLPCLPSFTGLVVLTEDTVPGYIPKCTPEVHVTLRSACTWLCLPPLCIRSVEQPLRLYPPGSPAARALGELRKPCLSCGVRLARDPVSLQPG